jgi:hypothetical protein
MVRADEVGLPVLDAQPAGGGDPLEFSHPHPQSAEFADFLHHVGGFPCQVRDNEGPRKGDKMKKRKPGEPSPEMLLMTAGTP